MQSFSVVLILWTGQLQTEKCKYQIVSQYLYLFDYNTYYNVWRLITFIAFECVCIMCAGLCSCVCSLVLLWHSKKMTYIGTRLHWQPLMFGCTQSGLKWSLEFPKIFIFSVTFIPWVMNAAISREFQAKGLVKL